MHWFIIYALCVCILPFPVAFLYALIRRANKFLIITPLVISVIYPLALWGFCIYGDIEWGPYYVGIIFILVIIGAVGLYKGFVGRQYYYGESEAGLNAFFRCFLICFVGILFPIIPAGFFCWAVHKLHTYEEKVVAKRPELGQRPSWKDVVKEREEEEEGGG